MNKLLPISDPLTAPYWEHAMRGVFTLPRCVECTKFHFYPQPACPHCGSTRITWEAASGRGSLYSYSIVHRAPSAAFADDVPYVVAIIKTEEGPHLMSRVVGIAPAAVRIGLRLRVRLVEADPLVLPVFEPDEPSSSIPPAPPAGIA